MPLRRVDPNVITVIGGAVGVLLLVIGLVALARTGIPPASLTSPSIQVGMFGRTPLMAIIEVVVGVVVIATSATTDKSALSGVGLIALVFGIVWLIEPGAFQGVLGVGRQSAVLYLLVGLICLTIGLLGRYSGTTVVRERGPEAPR